MDAISFVLGVRAGQLRGAQLKDLVYAFDDKEKEQKGRRASVRLVHRFANSSELDFTRTITSSGGSEFQEDLALSTLKNCKQSQPVIKAIIESTADDEGMLFEALHFHDELKQVISKYEQLEATQKAAEQQPGNSDPLIVRTWKLLKSLEENCLGILMPLRVCLFWLQTSFENIFP